MPRASGAKSSRPGLNGAGRSLQGVVPPSVGPGATECDESKCSSRLLKRCRMVDSSSTSSSSSSSSFFLTDSQNSGGASEREREDKKTLQSQLCSFSAPLVLRHGLFLFPLTHSLRVLSQPPLPLAGCRVSLSSCHTGPPTLTHGGREGERNSTPTCCRRSSMMSEVCFTSQSNK